MNTRLNRIAELAREIEERQREMQALIDELMAEQENEEKEAIIADEAKIATEAPETADEPKVATIAKITTIDIDEPELAPEPEAPKPVSDIRKAFTINDRFRFRRELFAGDDSAFMAVLDNLAKCSTLAEADEYLAGMPWDRDSDVIAEFMAVVANHFNGYRL